MPKTITWEKDLLDGYPEFISTSEERLRLKR
jgi:hypothetical protein